jgi:hypothetical protein
MSLISFSTISDGTTATASQVNTPLSTIYNDYNGNITNANIASNAAIAGSKIDVTTLAFSAQVQSQANAGSAGGTMKYVNLGGIKMLWAHSGTIAATTSGTAAAFTLPVGFFSTIQTAISSPNNPNNTGSIYCETDSYNTTTVNVKVTPAVNSNVNVDLFLIGT